MYPQEANLVVQRTLTGTLSSARGATLLWAIGALLTLGGLGAAVAVISPSAVQSKLEQEAAMRAYYNANSGLNFIYSMEHTSEMANVNYNNFLNNMGGGAVVTYSLPSGGEFSFQLNSLNANGDSGNYVVSSLTGSVDNAAGGKAYSYVVYGGGKGSSAVKSYSINSTPVPNKASKYVLFSGESTLSIQGAATIEGDIYGKAIEMSQTTVKGNVVSQGDVDLGFASKVTGTLCSMGDVTLNQSEVSGSINADGDVDLQFASKVGGDIYAKGKVTMEGSVIVGGSIHAQEVVITEFSDSITGSIYSNDNVTIGNSTTVYGNVYSKKTISLEWNGKIVGVAIGKTVKVGSGSVGSSIITTSYPPNIAPTAPTVCASEPSPSPKSDSEIVVNSNNIDLSWGDTKYKTSNPLPPGSYGTVNLAGNNPLTLKAGTYYFKSLYLGWGSTLNLDLSAGDITIFCVGTFTDETVNPVMVSTNGSTWKSMTEVDKTLARKVYLEAHGAINLNFGAGWFGTLFSTKSIGFDGATTIIGAYATTGTNEVDWSANVVYVPSTYAMTHW